MKQSQFLTIIIFLICALSISSCRGNKNESAYANSFGSDVGGSHIVNSFTNATPQGELYMMMNGQLAFTDFNSMRSVVICSDPNCGHNDSRKCSSFGMTNFPMIYANNIYYFDFAVERGDKGQPVYITRFFRANTGGTERFEIKSFNGYVIDTLSVMIVNDTLYFPLKKQERDEYSPSDYSEHYLYSYNFISGESKELALLCGGNNSEIRIFGEYENKLYYVAIFNNEDNAGKNYYYYDISENTVKSSDLPEPVAVESKYYIYDSAEGITVLHENELHIISSLHSQSADVINDIIFLPDNNICCDINNRKLYKTKSLTEAEVYNVIAYTNDKYIIRQYKFTGAGSEVTRGYTSLSKEELIEGETSEYTLS